MILQALCNQYSLLAESCNDLPKKGFSVAKVSFALCIDDEGELVDIIDLREPDGKKLKFVSRMVPLQKSRSGKNPPPYFLCDNQKFVLGQGENGKTAFENFKEFHLKNLDSDHPICKFLQKWDPAEFENNAILSPFVKDILKGVNFVFYLDDEDIYAHESEDVIAKFAQMLSFEENETQGQCLVTGNYGNIARVHNKIKGIRNGQAAGGTIVGFNDPAFESYGKDQSYNAPIGEDSMFQYTTALNYMLTKDEYHSFLNDITVVFWANKPGVYPDTIKALLPKGKDTVEDIENRNLIIDLIAKMNNGLPLTYDSYELDPLAKVFILGLVPNNARIAIAFWQVNTFDIFIKRIADHYNNMEIIDGYEFLPFWRILNETIPKQSKDKKISTVMEKSFILSVFNGGMYPISLYQNILKRIKADGDVNPVRVSMIKAYLQRKYQKMNSEEVITVGLNEKDTNAGYQLGRLFAVLEKIQTEALGKDINATIKDRYFSSATASPAMVFPQLLKLSIHHNAKAINNKAEVKYLKNWEKVKCDILYNINTQFPKQLSMDDQGRFILGYYHQVKDFYTKKPEDNNNE